MGITLMEALEKAGYPREQMFNHNSDLYVFVTPVTTRVINDWCVAEGISKEVFLETFKDNTQEGQCTALHFSIFRIGKKGRNMNGLNLDEIAVLLERHGIACVVRNENGAEALRSVLEASTSEHE